MASEAELLILRQLPVSGICGYLAAKVRRTRLATKESQEAFAERAGISLRTFKRFEAHGKGSLETFVRALHALDRTRYLFTLFPQETLKRSRLLDGYIDIELLRVGRPLERPRRKANPSNGSAG